MFSPGAAHLKYNIFQISDTELYTSSLTAVNIDVFKYI